MPSAGGNYYGFWEADPRRWGRCLKQAGASMVGEGWHPKARKFDAADAELVKPAPEPNGVVWSTEDYAARLKWKTLF